MTDNFRRLTIIFPVVLDQNLEAYALMKKRGKGEIIKEALIKFLKEEGLQPDKKPNVKVSY